MAELNGMQGNEIADDFIRKGSAEGRWRDTWEVFKGNFWKLVVLNLIVLVTFTPGIAVVVFRNAYVLGMGGMYPFNYSIGYPFYPHEMLPGLAEGVYVFADMRFYALLIVAGLIASVGISGAAYCIRKLLQTHGEFSVKGFFHGVKVGYFHTLLPVTIFILFLYMTFVVGDWMHYAYAVGGNTAGATTAYVFAIIATVLVGLYLAWVFSVGVSYRVKLKYLFRNAFVLLIGTPIQTVFMAGFALIPVWLVLIFNGVFKFIIFALFAFFGFSFILISWLAFSQWAFDLYITPAIKSEKEAAKAQKSEKELAAEKAEEEKTLALQLLAAGKSELIARPIMPISKEEAVPCLGKTFTRAGVAAAAANREKLNGEVLAYEKAHENDPVYAEYNKMFAERERALNPEGNKGKKSKNKKISADNLLR